MSITENDCDPFALARTEDDAEILSLFREWHAGMKGLNGQRPPGETENEYDDPWPKEAIEGLRAIAAREGGQWALRSSSYRKPGSSTGKALIREAPS
jgi:hypothetical protein